jgi:hypothetical protein
MTLIYPALAQIAWTLVVLFIMGSRRVGALKAREVRMGDIALNASAFPERAKAAANNFSNQFETPLLFFVLLWIANEVGAKQWWIVALAWGFVATRVMHTLIHIGSNHVIRRFRVFMLGVACLIGMLLGVIIHVI